MRIDASGKTTEARDRIAAASGNRRCNPRGGVILAATNSGGVSAGVVGRASADRAAQVRCAVEEATSHRRLGATGEILLASANCGVTAAHAVGKTPANGREHSVRLNDVVGAAGNRARGAVKLDDIATAAANGGIG